MDFRGRQIDGYKRRASGMGEGWWVRVVRRVGLVRVVRRVGLVSMVGRVGLVSVVMKVGGRNSEEGIRLMLV